MHPPYAQALLMVLLALPALPAVAQYKVIRPDGSITYTDRPPTDGNVRVTAMGRNAPAAASTDNSLPAELRGPVSRYPVTLYTSNDCTPCDSGRKLLQQRGIPYTERRVSSEDDALALERAVGGRTVPALNVGVQPLRGYSESDWSAILDVAGYPKESKLPRNWPIPQPVPLVDRVAPAPAPARAAAPPVTPADIDSGPQSTIRF